MLKRIVWSSDILRIIFYMILRIILRIIFSIVLYSMNEILENSQRTTFAPHCLIDYDCKLSDVLTWTGTAWVPLAQPVELPAGTTNNILKWNGSAWVSAAALPLLPAGVTTGNVLTWNGSNWISSPVPTELPAGSPTNYILTWNGSAWVAAAQPTELPAGGTTNNILTHNGTTWVSAASTTLLPAGVTTNNVLTWNGSTWISSAPPTELPASSTTNYILTWNGSAWVGSVQPVELPASSTTNYVLTWNGSAWVGAALSSGVSSELITSTTSTTTVVDPTKLNSFLRGPPNIEWLNKMTTNNNSRLNHMTINSANVIVALQTNLAVNAYNANGTLGLTSTYTTGMEGALICYNKSGVAQWFARYVASTNFVFLSRVTCDSSDNIYLSFSQGGGSTTLYNAGGTSTVSVTGNSQWDGRLAKFNSSGTAQWIARMSADVSGENNMHCFAYGGNVYLTGYHSSAFNIYNAANTSILSLNYGDTASNVFIIKYNSSGTPLWAVRVCNVNGDSPYCYADDSGVYLTVVMGASGSITFYSAGNTSAGSTTAAPGVIIVKFDNNGNYLWNARQTSPSAGVTHTSHLYGGSIYTVSYVSGGTYWDVYNASGVKAKSLPCSSNTILTRHDSAGHCVYSYSIANNSYGTTINRNAMRVNKFGIYIGQQVTASNYFYNFNGTQYSQQYVVTGTGTNAFVAYSHDGFVQWLTYLVSPASTTAWVGGLEIDNTDLYVSSIYAGNSVSLSLGGTTKSATSSNTSDEYVAKIALSPKFTLANPVSTSYKNITSDVTVDGAITRVTPASAISYKGKSYTSINLLRNGASCNLIWNGTNWRVVSENDVLYV